MFECHYLCVFYLQELEGPDYRFCWDCMPDDYEYESDSQDDYY